MLLQSVILSISVLLFGSLAVAQEPIPVHEEDQIQPGVAYYKDCKRGGTGTRRKGRNLK
jgi:hypothetical protein